MLFTEKIAGEIILQKDVKKITILLIILITLILSLSSLSASNTRDTSIKKESIDTTKTVKTDSQIIYANSNGNSKSTGSDKNNPTTINNALKNVKNNGTIQLVTSTNTDKYKSLTINMNNTKANTKFTIEGEKGKNIILDGNREQLINPGNYDITLKNLEIANYSRIHEQSGETPSYVALTSVFIENCTIHDCGKLFIQDGDLVINNSVFTKNYDELLIWKTSFENKGKFIINNTQFINNSVGYIIDTMAQSTLNNVSFINNTASFPGSIILNFNNMTLQNSTLINNSGLLYVIRTDHGNLTYYKNFNQNNIAILSYSTGNINKTLYSADLKINTSKTEYQSKEPLKIQAILTNEMNHTINSGRINFTISGENLTEILTSNITNSKAECYYFIPRDFSGKLTITAGYEEEEEKVYDYEQKCYVFNSNMYNVTDSNKLQVNVTQVQNANLSLFLLNERVKVDESVQFKVVLNTNPTINSGKVLFKMDNKTLKDKNGNALIARVKNNTALLNYTIPDGIKSGYHTITATFGNGEYKRLSDQQYLRVDAINVTITAPSVITTNKYATYISGTIKDVNGHYTVGKHKLHIKINGVTVRDSDRSPVVIIAENGKFNASFQLPENVRAGTYNYTLVTGARTSYNKQTVNGKIIYQPYIQLKPDTTLCNNTQTIYKTKVRDETGNNVNYGKTVFYVDGNRIGEPSLKDGEAIIKFNMPKLSSTANIKVKYVNSNGENIVEKTQKVTIRNPTVNVTIKTDARVKQGKYLAIKTTVKDKSDKNVCSGNVNYTLQDKEVGTAQVVNGVATITIKIPKEYLGRNYHLNATFVSKNYDQIRTDSTTITITK